MTDEEIVAALAEALEAVAHWCEHEPCTTCQVISDEDFDAQIGARAMHGKTPTWVEGKPTAFAAALLPVVRHIAEQRAAEERTHFVTGMADLLRLTYSVQLDSGTPAARAESERVADVFRDRIADHCREHQQRHRSARRAAALTATPNHGRDVT